jgi:hypothetical protein
VITDQSEFDLVPSEELKDLGIVVLVDLDARDHFHGWPPASREALCAPTLFPMALPPNSVKAPDAPT